MDAYTEIDVEDIEAEIGARSEAVAEVLVIFSLFLILEIETEHAEGDMERDIFHDEDLHAGREIEAGLHVGGIGGAGLSLIRTSEFAISGSEREFHLIINTESAVAGKADILTEGGCGRIRLCAIHNIVQVEIHIVVDIYLKGIEITLGVIVSEPQAHREVVADKILHVRL